MTIGDFMKEFKWPITLIILAIAGVIITLSINGCGKYVKQDQWQAQVSIITNSVNVNVHNTLSNIFAPVIKNGDVNVHVVQTVYPIVVSFKDMKQQDFTNFVTNINYADEDKFFYSLPFTSQLFYRSYPLGLGKIKSFYPYPVQLLKTNK